MPVRFEGARKGAGLAAVAGAWLPALASAQTAPPSTPAHVAPVVVTATRPKVQVLPDRTVYSLAQDLQASTGSAADVLSQLPSVEVDIDGNLALRGDSHVIVLVDGKPSAQFSGSAAGLALQQFPASEIDRVEVMTNPPAQYKAAGSGGVINIITKKRRQAGLSGSVQGSWGDKGRALFNGSLSYGRGPLSASAGVVLRRDVKQRRVFTHREAADPASGGTVVSDERLRETLRRLTPLFKVAADDALDAKTSIGASATHQELTGHRYFDQFDVSAGPSGPAPGASERRSDGHEWNKVTEQEIHLDRKLAREGQDLSLSASRSVERERERYAYLNLFTLPPGPDSRDDLHLSHDLVTNDARVDLTLPFGKERTWKAGYDFEGDIDYFDNRGDTIDPATGAPIPDPSRTNHFRYSQKINAAYASFEGGFGKWRLESGLRFEQADIAFRPDLNGPFTRGSNRGLYPSLHLERALGDRSRWTLAIGRRVNRPDPEALDPSVDYQDIRNPRAGNPNLKPEDIVSVDTGYGFDSKGLSYSLDVFYRFSRNGVTDVTQVIGPDVVLTTKANLPKSRSGGLEFTGHGSLGRRLSYLVDATVFYNQIDARALGASGLQSTVGLNAKVNLDYKPTRLDTLQIAFSRSDRRLTPQGYVGAIDLVNLGYRRQLSDKLAFVATVSDVFNGQVFLRSTAAPGLNQSYRRQQLGGIVYAGFVYTFGSGGKAKKAEFEYDK